MEIWNELYNRALAVQNGRSISSYMDAGEVAAAVQSGSGNIYVGVCIDTACSLGMCAERNALANMITNGEHIIRRVVAVMPDGSVGAPCGACREFMMQMGRESMDAEILLSLTPLRTVTLRELCPDWWIRYGAADEQSY